MPAGTAPTDPPPRRPAPRLDEGHGVAERHSHRGNDKGPGTLTQARGGDLDLAANDVRAVQLRMAGLSYKAIGEEMNTATQTAYDAVKRALHRWGSETVEEHRRLELMRLDQVTSAVWPKIIARDPDLLAVRTFLQIVDRRARLMGLYQPDNVNIGVLETQSRSEDEGREVIKALHAVADALGAEVTGEVIDVDADEDEEQP